MHRKKTRRWHKLLSVSGIIVAVFGMFYVPAANAQLGGPVPDGLYGPTYSKDDAQVWYLDLPNNVTGFQNTDMYVTGTATGCVIDSIPPLVGFSFGFWVRGCSDGSYKLNLKAESISYQNGITGPTVDFVGSETTVDRSPLTIEFINTPLTVDQSTVEFQLKTNHPMVYLPFYDFSLTGIGCNLTATNRTSYGLSVVVSSCTSGAQVSLILNPYSIQDKFGNNGPLTPLTSPTVSVNYATASPTSTPTPTATPTPTPTATSSPTASPIDSPTASPTATPTPTPTPSDTPASVAVVNPPTEPPAPPTEPEPAPVVAPVTDAAPTPVEVVPEVETAISIPPIAVVRSKIVQVRKNIAKPEVIEPAVEQAPVPIEPHTQVVTPAIETTTKPSFNWQPVGYLALAVGGAAGAVGGGLLLQRMARVRRLRFS